MRNIWEHAMTLALVGTLLPSMGLAQEKAAPDSAVIAVKMKNLETQITALDRQIKTEDAKRDQTILGVSAEQLEVMNNRQDSVCLALRSQKTDKQLELKELAARQATAALAQPLSMLQQQDQNSGATANSTQPEKTLKTVKPSQTGKPTQTNKPARRK